MTRKQATPFFHFDLPEKLIATTPAPKREESRLMVLNRKNNSIHHHHFYELSSFLQAGDILLLNETKVLPAKIEGKRKRTGGKVEILCLGKENPETIRTLCKGAGKLKMHEPVLFPGNKELIFKGRLPENPDISLFQLPDGMNSPEEWLLQHGSMPLPPYIEKERKERKEQEYHDRSRYQCVFARQSGSVAAPTAGLHFTQELLGKLTQKGVKIHTVTLHVGTGTFKPVRGDYREHAMEPEVYSVPLSTLEAVMKAKKEGQTITATGSTVTRCMETLFADRKKLEQEINHACKQGKKEVTGETALYIHTRYSFQVVDHLITNFHLPSSTLLLLAGAFAGNDLISEAYREAIKEEYRFYSYGDAMIIL